MSDYVDRIIDHEFTIQPKDIFDFVWVTVELNRVEVCLFDSPLLQRLRRIKQLGMAYTVYCNADYSRFSHTVGVVEVAGRMADTIAKKLPREAEEMFSFVEVVRLAAILHDVGHMFYSHVSEKFYSNNKNYSRHDMINRVITTFNLNTNTRTKLHELISVMIVNTTQVRKLLQNISRFLPNSHILKRPMLRSSLSISLV